MKAVAKHNCIVGISSLITSDYLNVEIDKKKVAKGDKIELPVLITIKNKLIAKEQFGNRTIIAVDGNLAYKLHEADFTFIENKKEQLTDAEKQSIKVLNFLATHDGIITSEREVKYMLQQGIEKFISKKRRHLVSITENAYPIRIKY